MKKRLALVLALMLALPISALAAEYVGIEDGIYTEAASGSGAQGGTWSWDGADDLQLDNYTGEALFFDGDLTITLSGENHLSVVEGGGGSYTDPDQVSLVGNDGASLDIDHYDHPDYGDRSGHVYLNADVAIENLDLNLNDGTMSVAGSLSIKDSEVDGEGSSTRLDVNTGFRAESPYLTIDNSHVHVINTFEYASQVGEYRHYPESAVHIYAPSNDGASSALWDYMRENYYSEDFKNSFDEEKFAADYPEIEEKIGDLHDTWEYFTSAMSWFSVTETGQELMDIDHVVKFVNVEGDMLVRGSFWKGFSFLLMGDDYDHKDILLEPIVEEEPAPEPAAEEKIAPAETVPAVLATELPATGDVASYAPLAAAFGVAVLSFATQIRIKDQDKR